MRHFRHPGSITACILFAFLFIASCTGHEPAEGPVNPAVPEKPKSAVRPDSRLPAEDPTFVIPEDTVSAYGPRSITRNILQDRSGNIWLATWEGILRYDGKRFTNVTLQEGLRHFHVFSILEDKAGNLWFGTIGGGVYRYDGASFAYFTTADGLAGNTAMCMLEDISGNIWIGTQTGISRYDGNTFTNFTSNDGLAGGGVISMAQDGSGKLWLGMDGGICCYDPASTAGKIFTPFTNEKGLPFYRVRSIITDKTGNLWIGAADGLCRYDGKTLTNFPEHVTINIFEDKTGNLWLSENKAGISDMTLTRYDGKSFKVIKSAKQIFGVTEDRSGNLWFGTLNGACRYDGRNFSHFQQ